MKVFDLAENRARAIVGQLLTLSRRRDREYARMPAYFEIAVPAREFITGF